MTISFQLAFYAGIVLSFPFLIYFAGQFILPALTPPEKKAMLPAVGIGFGLFLTGVVLGYYLVLPATLRFFFRDAQSLDWTPTWTVRDYFSFVTQLCVGFGAAFELPVIVLVLVRLGVLSVALLRRTRAYAFVLIFVAAAFLAPTPDAVSMAMMGGPMYLLYEICILVAWLMEQKEEEGSRRARAEEWLARKYLKPMARIYIKTYGCQMNERDSEQVAQMLMARGHSITVKEEEADVILLNTCSVRDLAEQKALGKMGMLRALSRDRPIVYGFLGCMAQSRGSTLLNEVPHLDLVVGTQKFHRVADYVDQAIEQKWARALRRCPVFDCGRGRRTEFPKHHPGPCPRRTAGDGFRIHYAGMQHALHVLHCPLHARPRTKPAP